MGQRIDSKLSSKVVCKTLAGLDPSLVSSGVISQLELPLFARANVNSGEAAQLRALGMESAQPESPGEAHRGLSGGKKHKRGSRRSPSVGIPLAIAKAPEKPVKAASVSEDGSSVDLGVGNLFGKEESGFSIDDEAGRPPALDRVITAEEAFGDAEAFGAGEPKLAEELVPVDPWAATAEPSPVAVPLPEDPWASFGAKATATADGAAGDFTGAVGGRTGPAPVKKPVDPKQGYPVVPGRPATADCRTIGTPFQTWEWMLSGKTDLPLDQRARAPDGVVYFECTIRKQGVRRSISVGLIDDSASAGPSVHLGGDSSSLGWYGRDGNFYGSGMPAGPRFGRVGDTIGVGYCPSLRAAFFTLNGVEMPPVYTPEWFEQQGSDDAASREGGGPPLFACVRPCVCMSHNTEVNFNFGSRPFGFARMEAQRGAAIAAAGYRHIIAEGEKGPGGAAVHLPIQQVLAKKGFNVPSWLGAIDQRASPEAQALAVQLALEGAGRTWTGKSRTRAL